jgi:hypothetical protein
MNCHEFEDRLHRLLDDRQAPEADGALAAHAAECRPCGQLLTGQRLLLAGLRRGAAVGPTDRLADKRFATAVLADYRAEPIQAHVLDRAPGRRVWQVLAWAAATAAALAIAVSIYLSSQPRRPGLAVSPPERGPKTVQPLAAPPSRSLAHNEAGPARKRGSRGPLLAGFSLLPPSGYGATLADMATSSIPEAVERMEEVERYAPGIRPIRVSFAMLWNALWRSIPGLGSDGEHDPNAWYGRHDPRRLV